MMAAGIHTGSLDEKVSPPALQKAVEVVPHRQARGITEDSPVVDQLALFVLSRAHDFELEAVVVHVDVGHSLMPWTLTEL